MDCFSQTFSSHLFWWVIYSIPVIFVYKWFNIRISFQVFFISSKFNAIAISYWKLLLSLFFGFIVAFLFFYRVWRLYIWFTTFKVYLVAFVIQQLDQIKNEIAPCHWCFLTNLASLKKWFRNLFDNIIWVMISHYFYVITLQMYYLLFIVIFRRVKVNCNY